MEKKQILHHEILKEHSRKQAEKIAHLIMQDSENFALLVELFFYGEYRVTQRASWPLSILAEKHPEYFEPFIEKIILNLKNQVHDAVKRNSTKILLLIEVPENLKGVTIDIMFSLLLDKKQPVAIKANVLSILHKLCKNEPDLIREIKLIVEDQMPYASQAFTGRASKLFKF